MLRLRANALRLRNRIGARLSAQKSPMRIRAVPLPAARRPSSRAGSPSQAAAPAKCLLRFAKKNFYEQLRCNCSAAKRSSAKNQRA